VSRLARQLGGLALILSVSARAGATESQVGLELQACPELSETELREHLDLELSTLGLSGADARLLLRCEQSSVVVELVLASGASYPVQVRVELRDTAKPARERLVALAASELIAQAERARVNQPPRPAPRPTERDREADAASFRRGPDQTASTKRPRIELFVAGNAALQGRPQAALWGGSLGTRWGVTHTWSVLFETRLERGQQSEALADVRWTLLSGFVGAGANAQAGPLQLSAGLGVRAGWLALAASARRPNEGRSFTAPWAGMAVPLRLALDVGGFVAPFLGVEAGYVALPVHGQVDDGSVLVEQRGAWLSGSVGVAVAL
jgi:hypothetical protein